MSRPRPTRHLQLGDGVRPLRCQNLSRVWHLNTTCNGGKYVETSKAAMVNVTEGPFDNSTADRNSSNSTLIEDIVDVLQ